MIDFLFYTTEGHTYAPNESVEVENCQVLGIAKGIDKSMAQKNLLEENPWIVAAGFDPSKFIVRKILNNELQADIKKIVDYLWEDEQRHYEESEDKDNHIFSVIKRLKGI